MDPLLCGGRGAGLSNPPEDPVYIFSQPGCEPPRHAAPWDGMKANPNFRSILGVAKVEDSAEAGLCSAPGHWPLAAACGGCVWPAVVAAGLCLGGKIRQFRAKLPCFNYLPPGREALPVLPLVQVLALESHASVRGCLCYFKPPSQQACVYLVP